MLNDFSPDQIYVLDEGDILYIPPRIPHRGISLSEGCTTISMGFRAPTYQSLLTAFCAFVCKDNIAKEVSIIKPTLVEQGGIISGSGETNYYNDADLISHTNKGNYRDASNGIGLEGHKNGNSNMDDFSGFVSQSSIKKIRFELKRQLLSILDDDIVPLNRMGFNEYLGRYLTEPLRMHIRSTQPFFLQSYVPDHGNDIPLSISSRHGIATTDIFESPESVVEKCLNGKYLLRRAEGIRVAYVDPMKCIFVNGNIVPIPDLSAGTMRFISILTGAKRSISYDDLVRSFNDSQAIEYTSHHNISPKQCSTLTLLCSLICSGYYYPINN